MANEGQPGRYRLRRTTRANRINEVTPRGEGIFEEDTGTIWVGDGVKSGGNLVGDPRWLTTGIFDGGIMTIASTTSVDITAGYGVIVDNSDPQNRELDFVSWSDTELTLTNVATELLTDIKVDLLGAFIQTHDSFTFDDYNSYIVLGRAGHRGTSISSVDSRVFPVYSIGQLARDVTLLLGPQSTFGNEITANGANLSIDKAVGGGFRMGAHYDTDQNDPNHPPSPAATAPNLTRIYDDGTGSDIVTVPGNNTLDPGSYDDGSGTLATVPGVQITVQKIGLAIGSNSMAVFYGRDTYTSFDNARAAAPLEVLQTSSGLTGIVILSYILVRGNATDLSDPSDAEFVSVAAATAGGGGGTGGGGDMLKSVYDTGDDGRVDEAEALEDGTNTVTAAQARSHIDDATIHRAINDAGVAATDLWSADKIITELGLKVDDTQVSATPGTADAIIQADGSGELSLNWFADMVAGNFIGRGAAAGTGPPQDISPTLAFLAMMSIFGSNTIPCTLSTSGVGTGLGVSANGIIGRNGTGPITSPVFSEGDVMTRLTSGDAQMENLKDLILDAAVDFGPRIFIWGEESGTMNSGTGGGYQYSWGNGATGSGTGVVIPVATELIAVGVMVGDALNTSTIAVRGGGSGGSDLYTYTLPGTDRDNIVSGLSTTVPAGLVNFKTNTNGGTRTGPCNIAALLKIT